MTKYVQNPDGGVHSVPDDFEFPPDWNDKGKWVKEADAKSAAPTLFGEWDPAVAQAEIHEGPDSVPVFNTEDGEPDSGKADVQEEEVAPQE